jgi:hypothetical protein
VSYNPAIGSDGATAILSSLPKDIQELGMVGCGLGDDIGERLVEYIQQGKNLVMVCVEENFFHKNLKMQFSISSNKKQIVQL